MKIQIAGSGCPKCKETEKIIKNVCSGLGIKADISKFQDPVEIAKLGIRLTPAVIINGKIVTSGKVPDKEEIKKIIEQHIKEQQ